VILSAAKLSATYTGPREQDKLQEEHNTCLREFVVLVTTRGATPLEVVVLRGIPGSGKTTWAKQHDDPSRLIVVNTNLSVAELAPYCQLALAYGHQLRVLTFACTPEQAMARHPDKVGVPTPKLIIMAGQLQQNTRLIPARWNHKVLSQH
jgi:hypothetical protein